MTDLSNAYDFVDHGLLLQKMEHIVLRGKVYAIVESYPTDRKTRSSRQGGKLSGQFFGIYTLEMTRIDEIINNEESFKYITGRNIKHNKTSEIKCRSHRRY